MRGGRLCMETKKFFRSNRGAVRERMKMESVSYFLACSYVQEFCIFSGCGKMSCFVKMDQTEVLLADASHGPHAWLIDQTEVVFDSQEQFRNSDVSTGNRNGFEGVQWVRETLINCIVSTR